MQNLKLLPVARERRCYGFNGNDREEVRVYCS